MGRQLAGIIVALLTSVAFAQKPPALPIFDAHLHYNVEAWAPFPPDKVFALFAQHNILGIIANSRPNEGSWTLLKHPRAANMHIVPFVRVYRDRDDYGTWFAKPDVYAHIVAELDREPRARGIGEFHLSLDQANHPGVEKIVKLARERDLWLHAHADEGALRQILRIAPKAKVIWAHTGFTVPTETVSAILKDHPNVLGELSYRWDVASGSTLSAAWRALFTQYPERFLLGSDTWVNQRWEMYGETMAQYRAWLAELPSDVARKIAYENAQRVFGLKAAAP